MCFGEEVSTYCNNFIVDQTLDLLHVIQPRFVDLERHVRGLAIVVSGAVGVGEKGLRFGQSR